MLTLSIQNNKTLKYIYIFLNKTKNDASSIFFGTMQPPVATTVVGKRKFQRSFIFGEGRVWKDN